MQVKRKRRFPWWTLVWILVLAGGGGGYAWWSASQARQQAAKLPSGVQVAKVELGDLDQTVSASGVVAAQVGAKVNIGAQISGRIASLPADVGTVVRAGQVVATIDSPDLQAQVEQQRQSVNVARATLAAAMSRVRQAELNHRLSVDQTNAQIQQGDFAIRAAAERLRSAEIQARMTPAQTAAEVTRAEAALSTARSQERQTQETVALQLSQTQSTIDEAKAAADNYQRTLNREAELRRQGFISQQQVDDTQTALRQAQARLANASATYGILKQKTQADLQAARDQVLQAQATVDAARAARQNDAMRVADEAGAREAVRQAEADLRYRQTGKTQDTVRRRSYEEAISGVNQARASLRQAEALLRYQEALLAKAVVKSPIDGTVLTIAAQQGETVAASFQTPTLITVADLNRLEVRAYVDEVDVGRIRLGLPADVRVESFQGRVFPGEVVKIASASTVKDNVVTYETTVRVKNTGGLLRPDMTADVMLILGRTRDVIRLPTEAVHREVKRAIVYVLHREKAGKERVETRTVTVGVSAGAYTQIRSGLKPGEEVILAGLQRLGIRAVDAQSRDARDGSATVTVD